MYVEGPEDRTLSSRRWSWMGDGIDKEGEPHDVGEEDEFLDDVSAIFQSWSKTDRERTGKRHLSRICTHLPHFRQELDPSRPFSGVESGFTREVVEMSHEAFEDED